MISKLWPWSRIRKLEIDIEYYRELLNEALERKNFLANRNLLLLEKLDKYREKEPDSTAFINLEETLAARDSEIRCLREEIVGHGQERLRNLMEIRRLKKLIPCETCNGSGEIDETLGGGSTSNPHAPCPDCTHREGPRPR